MKDDKTNVMRLFDAKKIAYTPHTYAGTGALAATEVAEVLGIDPRRVFKTLVTVAKSGQNYVFVIPAGAELDLKAAARAVGEKAIAMIPQKDLLPKTGYIHGGCSPLGMKKPFPTVIDESVNSLDTFLFSAGKIGWQVECTPADLSRLLPYKTAAVTVTND